ncbi:MAG: tetratricopeptide repeat protein, partial [Deltaproteobacteria bacterium]|nr:tetratricopeptide repeat protein [Nannocystaceae bacterium]
PATTTPPAPPKSEPAPGLPSSDELLAQAKAAGDDRTKLDAVVAKLDARIAAQPSATDHFLRAQLLDRLQRREDALAALDSALRLDPKHAGAHHLAGLVAADLGRMEVAFEHWSAAARATPPDGGAAYNAGQYLQDAGRHEEALAMWRIALAAKSDDFDAAKKIVQSLNALGQHEEAETAKQEVKRIFAASTGPGVKQQNEFVIDQLVVDGRKVMIKETIEPKDPALHQHWTAYVFAVDGKTPELTVQLESSQYGRDTGVPFINGMTRGSTHATWPGQYDKLPAYGTWRAAAIAKIATEV